MTAETLLTEELRAAGWTLSSDGRAIEKTFGFKGFREALAWMVRAGFEAEAADHHPEWTNVYNRVAVRLTTHDAGGLTSKDTALALAFEAL
ncbi:MAG: 4a-hydroxytetrahydrobiopterin dehydratase [Pseudomonadota bacterium]